jgi:hypothetical protein
MEANTANGDKANTLWNVALSIIQKWASQRLPSQMDANKKTSEKSD